MNGAALDGLDESLSRSKSSVPFHSQESWRSVSAAPDAATATLLKDLIPTVKVAIDQSVHHHPRVFTGERKRKILCSRESDRVVVSDQRCHGTTRPAVITEPCNTECELRFVQQTVFQPVPLN